MKTTLDNAMALIRAAEDTGVEPTHWLYGAGAVDVLRDVVSPPGPEHSLSKRTLFGVDLKYGADLPRLRVVLMAGQHTVGAFTCGVAE